MPQVKAQKNKTIQNIEKRRRFQQKIKVSFHSISGKNISQVEGKVSGTYCLDPFSGTEDKGNLAMLLLEAGEMGVVFGDYKMLYVTFIKHGSEERAYSDSACKDFTD